MLTLPQTDEYGTKADNVPSLSYMVIWNLMELKVAKEEEPSSFLSFLKDYALEWSLLDSIKYMREFIVFIKVALILS